MWIISVIHEICWNFRWREAFDGLISCYFPGANFCMGKAKLITSFGALGTLFLYAFSTGLANIGHVYCFAADRVLWRWAELGNVQRCNWNEVYERKKVLPEGILRYEILHLKRWQGWREWGVRGKGWQGVRLSVSFQKWPDTFPFGASTNISFATSGRDHPDKI